MKTLKREGLFGEGLISVNTPKLIDRYNTCLKDIGIDPTSLANFTIDGMGWSPEIAAEKKDNFYLSHGGANQFAIILTPKQYKKPVYFPFHSFTRNLMQEVFDRYLRHIADITRETAIWLDIDQDMSHYLNPVDLLMVDSIIVHPFTVSRIMAAAREQRELTRQFADSDACFDSEVRKKIIESAKTHGDLRFRSLIIPDIPFTDTRSFYTMAFDGVYVFRDDLREGKSMLILENKKLRQELGDDMKGVFSVTDSMLPSSLVCEGLLRTDLSYYRKHPEALEIKRECIFVDILSKYHPDRRYDKLNLAQKRRFARDLKAYLPKEFFEMERLSKQIQRGQTSDVGRLSHEMIRMLMYPDPNLPQSVQDILWQLITEIKPMDVLLLYTYNKSKFFELYQEWPKNRKRWAVKLIRKHYVPHAERVR